MLSELQDFVGLLRDTIVADGDRGIVFYIIFYTLATIFLIPASFLTLGAGSIYGVIKGSILVSLTSTLAASIAFSIGRYLLRTRVEQQIEKRPNFRAIDKAVGEEGGKIVLLTRLSPLFPYVFLNYAFSVTNISLKDFTLASWIGMMPGTVMYVYIGSLAKDITLPDTRPKSSLEWGLYLLGLVATIAVTLYTTRLARLALQNQTEKG